MTTSPTSTAAASNEHESASSLQPPVRNRVCRYFSKTGDPGGPGQPGVSPRDFVELYNVLEDVVLQGLELIYLIGSCRAGKECPFLHNEALPSVARVATRSVEMTDSSASDTVIGGNGMIQDRTQAVNKRVPASRVVAKPVPQAATQDPREFQLGQIRRRFNPKESKLAGNDFTGVKAGTTLLQFKITPSDPDFPFEMSALEVSLSVPAQYPSEKPSLGVHNKDIPRGFAFNVESGFSDLVSDKPNATLLELMKALDKNLEVFLSVPKAETVKIVPNKDTRHLAVLASRPASDIPNVENKGVSSQAQKASAPTNPEKFFTPEQKGEAAKRREVETRQLEARMGRLPLYKKSGDGIAYTVPIEPKKRNELPIGLQAVKSVKLFVPTLYPLQPCRVQLEGVDPAEAKPVEHGFEQKSIEGQAVALMFHINYLAQNMHILATTFVEPKVDPVPIPSVEPEIAATKGKQPEGHQDAERSHIQYITRPPEWTVIDQDDLSATDSEDLYSYDTGDEFSDGEGGVKVEESETKQATQAPATNQERGTAISFPFIELYGVELLEVTTLNITVKCERCKEVTEVKGLKDGVGKKESCRKCATPLHITYRKDLVHANAVRAGFLDLEGCIIGDMLLSSFTPTCSTCSTSYPSPGITSIRGETTSNICRECHTKFTFSLPEIKFLRISTTHLPSAAQPRRKKETLGLVPGTELPKRGRCRHYAKSYRWFRFSCCQKVYACDRCHDEGEEHHNEWANRMICGHCSREQNYRPEDCGVCHGSLVGRRGGGGFWEGGKGTRDRVKMSRKDKRKFRRPGGAAKAN